MDSDFLNKTRHAIMNSRAQIFLDERRYWSDILSIHLIDIITDIQGCYVWENYLNNANRVSFF